MICRCVCLSVIQTLGQGSVCSFIRLCLPSFPPSVICSFQFISHLVSQSVSQSGICVFVHLFVPYLIPSIVPSFFCVIVASFIHSFIPSFIPAFIHPFYLFHNCIAKWRLAGKFWEPSHEPPCRKRRWAPLTLKNCGMRAGMVWGTNCLVDKLPHKAA